MIKKPSEEFWNQCLNKAEEHFKGQFVRLDQQAFILGCGCGYGAANVDWQKEIENLKMVCRRLAAAKTIESRDSIAKQCHSLFEGSLLREAPLSPDAEGHKCQSRTPNHEFDAGPLDDLSR